MIMRLFFFFMFLVASGTAAHADDYIAASWPDLLRTLIRFNAMPFTTDLALLDEYAQVTECEIYKSFYHDDFKWNTVRKAFLQSIKDNISIFPTRYRYVTARQLERYNFQNHVFKFTDKSIISNVNSFVIYSVSGHPCEPGRVNLLPRTFRAVIPEPIYMDGLPLGETEAKTLIEYMNKYDNGERVVWLRFNMRMVYVEPVIRSASASDTGQYVYKQGQTTQFDSIKIDARIEAIDVFEDEELTKLIYSVQL